MRLTIEQIDILQDALKNLAEYRSYDEGLNDDCKKDLKGTMGLYSDEQSIYDTLLLLLSKQQTYDVPDTVIIDISGGLVEEISANLPIHVILLDSDLESLDVEDLSETFELNGTQFATRDTGLASYNPSRTELVYKSVQERDARVRAEKEARIESTLLTQADYDRFNEIFRVETNALGRSTIKANLRGLEYVDEEVYGKEEEIRLFPLKAQGQQFDITAPITKPVPEMIQEYVKLSKLYDFDANLVQKHFLQD